MQEFIEKIIKTLEGNGFPEKKVSLPTEKMYEAADNRGLSFNKVLESMNSELHIEAEIGEDRIVFSKVAEQEAPFGADQGDMFQKAQEMMAKMDPAQLKQMQDMLMNMSDEEKEELMKKGKDMGLI